MDEDSLLRQSRKWEKRAKKNRREAAFWQRETTKWRQIAAAHENTIQELVERLLGREGGTHG